MNLPVIKTSAPTKRQCLVRALFWTPNKEVAISLQTLLAKSDFESFGTDEQSVVGVLAEDIEHLARILGEGLGVEEHRAIKALIFEDEEPSLADFAHIETVESFVHHHSTRWLVQLIDEGRYKSLMQPIVTADGGDVHGYEFLLRGLKVDGEIVPPIEMFAAARDEALAALLDGAARDSAVRTAARFGLSERLFINVLPASVTVKHSSFADTLDLIEAACIEPERVVFEIVESEAVEDIGALAEVIDFCRSAGYRIALDDFGSGFNNLNMMIGLNPDYIKLDKSLISRIADEPPIWNLVANMIDGAKQSDVLVIAEGVEDERTASLLRALGADFLQGYLLGRPTDRPLLRE